VHWVDICITSEVVIFTVILIFGHTGNLGLFPASDCSWHVEWYLAKSSSNAVDISPSLKVGMHNHLHPVDAQCWTLKSDLFAANMTFFAVNDPDFKAGVASLAQLLQIPPHLDHLVVLKVLVLLY